MCITEDCYIGKTTVNAVLSCKLMTTQQKKSFKNQVIDISAERLLSMIFRTLVDLCSVVPFFGVKWYVLAFVLI